MLTDNMLTDKNICLRPLTSIDQMLFPGNEHDSVRFDHTVVVKLCRSRAERSPRLRD